MKREYLRRKSELVLSQRPSSGALNQNQKNEGESYKRREKEREIIERENASGWVGSETTKEKVYYKFLV